MLCGKFTGKRGLIVLPLLSLFWFAWVVGANAQHAFSVAWERKASHLFTIKINGRLLMRVRSAGSHKSIEERAQNLALRLEHILESTFDQPPDFYLRVGNASVKAFCNGEELFEVSREDARLNNSNPLDLAALWLNNFQMEFYRLRGYYYNPTGKVITGFASWYGPRFKNRTTSSGEVFNPYAFTCAHREFPFNTVLLVTNLANGKQVVVRVNDRGPARKNRIIDLSMIAARTIGLLRDGVEKVKVEVVNWPAQ